MTDARSITPFPAHRFALSPDQVSEQQRAAKLPSLLMAPMRYSQYYLWGTVAAFLMGNLVKEVKNFPVLMIFLALAFGGFYLGYRVAIGRFHAYALPTKIGNYGETVKQQYLVLVGAIYFSIWGLAQISEFGAGGIGDIIQTILNPGAAYSAKFDVYQAQIDSGYVSPVVQVLTLLSIIYALFLPLAVASWSALTNLMRWIVVGATAIYAGSYLFIGTMKGLGDILLFIVCGAVVLVGKRSLIGQGAVIARRVRRLLIGMGVLLFAYMAINQLQRAEEFQVTQSEIVGDISDTILANTLGPKAAYGIYQVLAYPSHGYLGLSNSMSVPFQFSGGAGLSQAYDSYRLQYLGGKENIYLTYPYRAEPATGWPAGMYWSTIFPWLASDLTFYLVPLFMALVGAIYARVWVHCLYGTNVLSLAALGQFFVFVAFIPANNQVLMLRQGFLVVLTLIGLMVARSLVRPRA